MRLSSLFAVALSVGILGGGLTRVAFASTATCQRIVTRSWDPLLGQWVYTDGGCPSTTCDGGATDTCYASSVLGTNVWSCSCLESAGNACVAGVHWGPGGPDIAYCDNELCPPPNWCPQLWTPIHGQPQTLTCPCVF